MNNLKTEQNNYEALPLRALVDFSLGGDWGKNSDEKLEDFVKVKVVRGTEFATWWQNKAKTAALRQIKKSSFDKRQLQIGDLVVEISGGGPNQPVGRVVVIDDEAIKNSDYPLVCSNFFRQIRLKSDYIPEFVRLAILFSYLTGELDKYQTSSTNLRNLNFNEFLDNIEIPTLVKEEQELVANKLSRSITIATLTKIKLGKAKKLVAKFRQSILSATVMGRLTEDWRTKNVVKNTVPNLFTKVKFEQSDIEGWVKTTVGSVYKSFGGGTPSRGNADFWNGDIAWVSSGDVKQDYIEKGSESITKAGLDNSSASLCPPSSVIVVVRSGILKHTLPVAIVTKSLAINQDIKCFDSGEKCLNHWLFLFLKGNAKQILELNREGTTVQSVKYETLKDLEINIPSLEEQEEIASKVSQYFEVADKVEEQIEKAEARVSKLTQALLSKTFKTQ